MKTRLRLGAAVLLGGLLVVSCGRSTNGRAAAITPEAGIEAKVDSVLGQMTLEEKVGQMTQITLDVIGKGDNVFSSHMPFSLDMAMVDTVITKYKVGSILNTATNVPMTNKQWYDVISVLQQKAIAATGIPLIYGVDEMHGATYTIGAIMFPQSIAMGATFNPSLVYEGARITAYETKAGNIPWNFAPVLDLGRDPRWARMWETYGEDSYLVSVMGEQAVRGYQGDDPNHIGKDRVAACLKHYMGYGVTFSGKDRTPSYHSEQDLRERHFAPFLQAIRAGALSVMVNSGMNNGLPIHMDYRLLTGWLKTDLNWDGVIVTDWADINNLYTRDKVASSKKEAIKLAINAGIDMSMVPYEWSFATYLKELVEEKEVPMSRIDDAVRRILRMKFRLNLFEKPYWPLDEYPDFASEKHAQVALTAAEEAITLLKNKNSILPLRKNARVLVTGPNANSMRTLNGAWTLSWQGDKVDQYAQQFNTILEAVQHKIGASNVVYEPGVTYKSGISHFVDGSFEEKTGAYYEENAPEISKAVNAARGVDYILLCLGENSYTETPGNLDDLYLSENQQQLALELAKTGKPVILILNEGRPRVISKIEPQMQAVVQIYLPGHFGGDALANILFGDVNPSGKLSYTYPKYPNATTTYDHKPSESQDRMQGAYDYNAVVSVQWPFGFGLSYTTFEYANLKVDKTQFKAGETLTFTVDVKNTGPRAGKESVLLFSSDRYASLTPDVRRLRVFDKISLEPGETKNVTLTLAANDLAFVGRDGRWVLEEGDFGIQVGSQVVEVKCTQTKKWTTPNR